MSTRALQSARANLAIATNTFRAAIRNKVFGSLTFFAVLIILASMVLAQMSLHEEARVVRDLTLFASTVFAAIIAVYSSVTLLFEEIDRRTIYTILSKPIHRWEFILGKFVGIMLLLAVVTTFLWGVSAGVLALEGAKITGTMGWAYFGIFCQMAIVTAVALFLASFSSPLLSGMITTAIFIVGHLFSHLDAVYQMLDKAHNPAASLVRVLQVVLPNLQALDLSTELTYSMAIPSGYVLSAAWYASAYAGLVLLCTMVVFSRRDFV